MPVENEPALVRFDAGAAVAIARERADEDLLVAAEFTAKGYNLIYLADEIVDTYGDETRARAASRSVRALTPAAT